MLNLNIILNFIEEKNTLLENENMRIKRDCDGKDNKIDRLNEEVKSLSALNDENEQAKMYFLNLNLPQEEIKDKLETLKFYLSHPKFKYDPLVCLFSLTITSDFLSKSIPPYKPSPSIFSSVFPSFLSSVLSIAESPIPTPIESYSYWGSKLGFPSFSAAPLSNALLLTGQKADNTYWVYFGEVLEGEAHGRGARVDGKGGVYVGEWKQGEMTGKGRKVYKTGD